MNCRKSCMNVITNVIPRWRMNTEVTQHVITSTHDT